MGSAAVRERATLLLDGLNGVAFANEGTSEGAIKGWETRRRGMVFFSADKGGGTGSSSQSNHADAVGKSGDWKSLGLPHGKDIPSTIEHPGRMDRETALAKLQSSYHETDPLGHRVEFGARIREHIEAHPEEVRPEWLASAEGTITHPAEIWRDGNRLRHVAVLQGEDGRRGFMVSSHQLHEHDTTIVTFSPKDLRGLGSLRKGTLLYVAY